MPRKSIVDNLKPPPQVKALAIACLAALAEEAEFNAGLRPQGFVDSYEKRLGLEARARGVDVADERRDRRNELADRSANRVIDQSVVKQWWNRVTLNSDEMSEELKEFIETISSPGPTWRCAYAMSLREVVDILHELPTEASNGLLDKDEVEILATILICTLIAENLSLCATSMILSGAKTGIPVARLAHVAGGYPNNPSKWITDLAGRARHTRPGRPRRHQ